MVCIGPSVSKAEPAKLVFANDARHVVASFVLLDFGLAHWTKPNATVFGDPAFEFVLHVFFTRATVPFVTALEADLRCTDRTDDFGRI